MNERTFSDFIEKGSPVARMRMRVDALTEKVRKNINIYTDSPSFPQIKEYIAESRFEHPDSVYVREFLEYVKEEASSLDEFDSVALPHSVGGLTSSFINNTWNIYGQQLSILPMINPWSLAFIIPMVIYNTFTSPNVSAEITQAVEKDTNERISFEASKLVDKLCGVSEWYLDIRD